MFGHSFKFRNRQNQYENLSAFNLGTLYQRSETFLALY